MKYQVLPEGRDGVTGAWSGGGTVMGLAGHTESQLSAGQQGVIECVSSACCPPTLCLRDLVMLYSNIVGLGEVPILFNHFPCNLKRAYTVL